MVLKYLTGEEIQPGDRVRYHAEPGEIEFVVDHDAPDAEYQWYLETQGAGVMILEPKVFGRVYVTNTHEDEDLELVSRRGAP